MFRYKFGSCDKRIYQVYVGKPRFYMWYIDWTTSCGSTWGTYQDQTRCTSCETFLVPDIIVWDPMSFFPHRVIFCSSCDEQGVKEDLHSIRWIDVSKTYEQPRLLYSLRKDVLLVSRVYLCKNKHQILSHDSVLE